MFWTYWDPLTPTGCEDASKYAFRTPRGHFKHFELFFARTILKFSKNLPITFPTPRDMFWSYVDPLSTTGGQDASKYAFRTSRAIQMSTTHV